MHIDASDPRQPPPFQVPHEVPEHVSEPTAFAMLHALKPIADESELWVEGLRCPVYERPPPQGSGGDHENTGLLLVHGLGHDASDFAPLLQSQAGNRHLLAIDLPGFGLADKPRRSYPLSLLAAAILQATERFASPPIVVASSLGGHVAMLTALREPDAFAGLILSAPGGLSYTPLPVQTFARAYYAYEAILRRQDQEIWNNAGRIFAKQNRHTDLQMARKIALHRSPLKSLFAWPFSSVVDDVFRHPVGERLRDIGVPVHILSGDQDVIVPAVECRIAAERAGVVFHSLPGVGHLPMLEVPEYFSQLIERCAQNICAGQDIH